MFAFDPQRTWGLMIAMGGRRGHIDG